MSDADRDAFEEHFFDCHVCAYDLRAGPATLQAKAGFAGTATTGRTFSRGREAVRHVTRPVWYRSAALPWAMAATLAVVAGYQGLFVVPALRVGRDVGPIALAPVTLRPESRGAEPVLTPTSANGPVSLAIEISDPPQGGEIAYDLLDSNGRRIVSGRAAAPAAGTPLLLLLPSWTVVGSMHYILTVYDAAPAGRRSLGEYRFAVAPQ